jgi:hypothetical protein
MNVIHASGTLKKYLEARAKGSPPEELKLLQLADEAQHGIVKRSGSEGNVIYLQRMISDE